MASLDGQLSITSYQHHALISLDPRSSLKDRSLRLQIATGKIAAHAKRVIREEDGRLPEERRQEIARLLNRTMVELALLAAQVSISLEAVAERNLEKLARRQEQNRICGSGDEREKAAA